MALSDNDHWEILKKEVTDYMDRNKGSKINFSVESKTTADVKYQQRIAEGRTKFYPFRMAQLTFVTALLISLMIYIYNNHWISSKIFILVTIMVLFMSFCFAIYIEKRFTKLQVLVEDAEKRIQYDSI